MENQQPPQHVDAPPSWGGTPADANGSGRPDWYDKPLVYLSDVEPIEPRFIDYPLLQAAMFHLVAGRPGIGKGALCARWISRCTNGEMYGEPRRALWLSSEDDAARDLRPRIDVAEGNARLLALVPDAFQLPRDIDWLHERIDREGDVGLVVIDPMSNHIAHTDSSVEEEVRGALQPLLRLAADLDVPMLGIRHVSTKEGRGNFLGRILGATGWVGVARAVLGVAQDYDGTVHVHAIKGNRVPKAEAGKRFRLVGVPYNGWGTTVVRAVDDGDSALDLDELISMATRQAIGAGSEQARWAVLRILREHYGQMESDLLDAALVEETGVTAKTARNIRVELKDRGWLRAFPERSPGGAISHWMIALTNAAPWPEHEESADALSNSYSSSLATENNARARVPDGILDSSSEQGELFHRDGVVPASGQDEEEPTGSSEEPTGSSPTGSSPELLPPMTCPLCGSDRVGPVSGRCHACGEKVAEGL